MFALPVVWPPVNRTYFDRAPALVAIAFLELGMDKYECVEFIRSKRHGAINKKQLDFLLSYKPTKSKSFIHGIKRFFAS